MKNKKITKKQICKQFGLKVKDLPNCEEQYNIFISRFKNILPK